ncbi:MULTISPECIES: serine--tRNA ligase [Paracoccus]|jgi:seryl-tRNA synthetase|uniref:Serine--tRNA ligase n=1 Tax=Paracoccus denitrificans (strain Pd 1222) TaxID=318586 RepID=SYS_PARDP|nr:MULTISPECIES: serine--tRNA ligase [Paracoccus]A1B4S2.1 RecName: Full=Serine--tRNA ligase; AltName: Full=Seryl-tRNA synthetase; Short=SerRS; AltName: Full=Seryl-tRNA(Ser/Sec) synthetase [Paracoccus denitrificans PD1222]ABL70516.1 seryl-tRNA synthetase [Paracoccus denitrificans PD1222]MBB4627400.1 seryl-tRNA synthetase [Paracoccus denitrificans]MCU7431190.1 serine--tRNA ligase [Paracoccus denitrificans]QAR25854.1 serine--tRNA ligase [Paracoccus denitrificans]UFS65740.1 serine--tRNA ligase [P
MHDIRAIRENPAAFDAALALRNLPPVSPEILSLDADRRSRIAAAEAAQAEQNKASKEAGAAKGRGDEAEFQRLRALVTAKKDETARLQAEATALDAKLRELLLAVPNLPLDGVPPGKDEDDNVEIRRWGEPRAFDFAPREHFEIEGVRPGMDFETAAKLSGSRFVVLKGGVARVHRALAQFMLDLHTEEHGLAETWAPVLVLSEMMEGTGQLPKFGEDSYQTREGWWLIPTSEVTLTNTVNGDLVDHASLPRRMVAHSQCFRSEAGSAGRDTSGMLRQHQFEKVEMVSITDAESGVEEHARMTRCAEAVLERLGLPYRTIVLCGGDMGFGARITHDLEVWLPGQGKYREISSVSYCGDFQARRMNARYRPAGGGKPEFVHTLNGSGLAVGRTLIAVLENGQQADGSVKLPEVLHPYLGGRTRLGADGVLA